MNYYYELKEGAKVFEQDMGRYLVMPDCSPATGGYMNYSIHDLALEASSRVWMENVNGVTLVKNEVPKTSFTEVHNVKEFMWIKLRAKTLK